MAICPNIFLIIQIYAFFFIDFSCYLFVRFLVSICKILGEGVKYINFRAKIKIIFVNIYIFFQSWRGWPPQPLSSSVTAKEKERSTQPQKGKKGKKKKKKVKRNEI